MKSEKGPQIISAGFLIRSKVGESRRSKVEVTSGIIAVGFFGPAQPPTSDLLLLYQLQFLNYVPGPTEFIDTPEQVADIQADRAVQVFIESKFVT